MANMPREAGLQAPDKGSSVGRGMPAFVSDPTAGIAIVTVLLFVVGGLISPQSIGSGAISGMLPFAAILALVALGQTLVIQQGGIDLSVPGVVSLSAVIVCYFSDGPQNVGLAIVYTFLAAACAGLVSGLLVSKIGVASIVATIGMNALLYGLNVKISGGTPVAIPASIAAVANGKFLGVTQLLYLTIAVTIVVVFVIKKTSFGRAFEAVGANSRAARAAGIVADRYQISAYVGASLLYAAGGILLGGLMQLPSPQQGDNYLMPSIAATVLGGTSLFGGKGNLAATVIAALFLTQLQQLVLTTGSSVGVQYLFQGAAILVGVGVYGLDFRNLRRSFASK